MSKETPTIDGTPTHYIDITPTWRGQMSICITILMDRDADYEAKQTAAAEIYRLADAVDEHQKGEQA